MSTRIRVLERHRTFTPLGIRFWDSVLGRPISETLLVHAWLRGAPYPPVRAVRSPGGVYSFHQLPGQEAAERPSATERHPERLGPPREYAIAVDDPLGHYLPVAFSVTLPLGYRGEFLSAGTSSPSVAAGRAYLFPGAARPAPPGVAVIRARLVHGNSDQPAAWAVLRATMGRQARTAIADERGRVLLLLPYPVPSRLRQASPPADTRAVRWRVRLSVRWEPTALRFPFPASEGLDPAWAERPSLKSVLDEQRPALVWAEEGEGPLRRWSETLVHGHELVLRTTLADRTHGSTVWISAAGASPP